MTPAEQDLARQRRAARLRLMVPTFDFDSEPRLLCPACGCEQTHIERVSMLDAAGSALSIVGTGEDDGCTMTVETGAAVPAYPGYIGRRQVVVIEVSCEGCDVLSDIAFRQHKGDTQVVINTERRDPEAEVVAPPRPFPPLLVDVTAAAARRAGATR